jgi:hypothetical protein
MRNVFLALLLGWSLAAAGAGEESTAGSGTGAHAQLDDLKMQKRFGIGFSAAGPLAVLGLEVDFNITETFSVSGGLGTGLDYSTMMVKGRYFLPGKWVSPYIAAGFARWWTSGTKEKSVSPSVLANRFLSPADDLTKGFNVWMVYPALGVQFMHPLGISFFAEAQYLFRLFSMSNGTYAGLGMHWYF